MQGKAKVVVGLLFAGALASAAPASAQVEKVALRTSGISCGSCAAVSEVSLRWQVPGVDSVAISRSQELVLVTYKPDAPFRPQAIRDIFQPLDVGIVSFQISAHGRVQEEGTKRVFIAGKDRFVLVDNPVGPQVPLAAPIVIEGILNDRVEPMQLKVMTSRPIAP